MSARGRFSPFLAVSLAVLIVAAGCSRRGGPQRRPPLPAGQAEAGGPAFQPPDVAVDEPTAAATRPATVVALRAASHGDFDRVTLELAGGFPGYRVAWRTTPPRQCGSGEAMSVPGRAWLEVRLDPAQVHDEQGHVTVEPRSTRPGLSAVQAIALACDFEGVASWAIGSPRKLPFRVMPLHDPPRVVVDVAHSAAAAAAAAPTP